MTVEPDLEQGQSLDELRAAHKVLRDEMTLVRHWRRLVRARIDLSVTAVLLPDRLGVQTCGVLPQETARSLPNHDLLARTARGTAGPREVFNLTELRTLERQLSDYGDTVRRNLEYTTDRLVSLAVRDPGHRLRHPRRHHETGAMGQNDPAGTRSLD